MGNPIIIKIIIIIMLSCHVDVIPKSSAVESSLFLLDCCKSVTLEINLPAGVMSDWPGIYVLSWGSEKKFPMKYIQKPDRGHSSLHRKLSDGIWTFGGGIKSVDNATCPADIQQWQYDDDYGNFDGFGDISVKCI